ncbi:hypothetical protein NEF87_003253 [Candidatus Lokiarchaeum ossiferum]|uniref:DUF4340 domain-containing protein n=1 Tax=Candidatus Lokiarchaeum ossiferum TaxID=2951803 RepID=A0ABY6HUE9_9ARCH|nr:hypothetical protein NEF87_003253 [Candidatus Lokiarchaeum sp. B-35]
MKKKITSLFFIGLFLISALGIGGTYIYSKLEKETHLLNITVNWNSSEADGYTYADSEPSFVEVYSLPERRKDQISFTTWRIVESISLVKTDRILYEATANLSLQANLIYIVKIPNNISDSRYIDNQTAVIIDKNHRVHAITLVHRACFVEALKPVIYFYNSNQNLFNETLSVNVPNGYVFKTIPEVELGQKITWNNFEVGLKSNITDNCNSYPYLFYEAMVKPFDLQTLQNGWVINKVANTCKVNDEPISNLQVFFERSLSILGLFDNEIEDFTNYWFEEQLLFDEEGTYILRQVPLDVIDDVFQLSTTHSYSVTRVFFTISYYSDGCPFFTLPPPKSVSTNNTSKYILHEWGLFF